MNKRLFTTYELVLVAVAAALLCAVGPYTLPLPFSPVPLSLASLGVGLTAVVFGAKTGVLACLLYLLMGLVGLPVFAGFTGGAGQLVGPTGGYLAGYLALAAAAGLAAGPMGSTRRFRRGVLAAGLVLGQLCLYLLGSLWLAHAARLSLAKALAVGVLPFLPGDALKAALTVLLGPRIAARLQREVRR